MDFNQLNLKELTMSVIHQFRGNQEEDDYQWAGVTPVEINTQAVHGVLKHILVGPDDGAPHFVIRYFLVPVGERTFFHQHAHEHGMVILHGNAKIQINEDYHMLSPLDAVFVSGGDLHQITNIGDSPLGFLCIIPKVEGEV